MPSRSRLRRSREEDARTRRRRDAETRGRGGLVRAPHPTPRTSLWSAGVFCGQVLTLDGACPPPEGPALAGRSAGDLLTLTKLARFFHLYNRTLSAIIEGVKTRPGTRRAATKETRGHGDAGTGGRGEGTPGCLARMKGAGRRRESENRQGADQHPHPVMALLAARPDLFARQGPVVASWRRRGTRAYGPYESRSLGPPCERTERTLRVLPSAGRRARGRSRRKGRRSGHSLRSHAERGNEGEGAERGRGRRAAVAG
jgi:hypothetical protein